MTRLLDFFWDDGVAVITVIYRRYLDLGASLSPQSKLAQTGPQRRERVHMV